MNPKKEIPSSLREVGRKNPGTHKPKRLNIRADSSAIIGSGHVSRMLPLAIEALKRGFSVRIIARELNAESQKLLLSRGIAWLFLPPLGPVNLETGAKFQTLVSQPMIADAIQTAQLAEEEFFEILVSDHYEITDEWFLKVQKSYDICAAVGDGYSPKLSIANIFDLEVWPLWGSSYSSKLEANPLSESTYRGNPYFLFSPELQTVEPRTSRHRLGGNSDIKVVLFLGFSDVEAPIQKLLLALGHLGKQFLIEVTLVTYPDLAERLKGCQELNIEVLHTINQNEFFQICVEADFVLGAPGVSSVERTKLGIPQLLFSIADNQLGLGERLGRLDVAVYGGDLRTLGPAELEAEIKKFAQETLPSFDSRLGQQMFDFFGAARMLQALVPAEGIKCSVRLATHSDGPTLFLWANDFTRRKNSVKSGPVLPREHLRWLEEKLGGESQSSIYIFLCNEQPAGQIQFHPTGTAGDFEVGYSLDAVFRGLGLAKRAIDLAMDQHSRTRRVKRYIATVKSTNIASIRSLTAVGFSEEPTSENGSLRLFWRTPQGAL